MNVCCFVGRMVRDPELTFSQSGTAICKFTLAVDNPFAKTEPKADFIPVTTFGKTAEAVANYNKKGSRVSASGRWQTGNYENNEGRKVYTNDMIADNVRFLESASSGSREGNNPSEVEQRYKEGKDPFIDNGQIIEIDDSDLPF